MDVRTQRALEAPDRISLRDILELLWSWRWQVTAFVAILTIGAAVAATLLPKNYKASIIVSPVTETPGGDHMGALNTVVSEFSSGLASLAGLSPSNDTTRRAETTAVLESESLTENYIREHNLLPILYADRWDAKHRRWDVSNPKKLPTLWKANRLFKRDVRTITTDNHTGLVTLNIYWKDPNLAAQWANGLVKQTNDYLRAKAIAENERDINYLRSEAALTDDLELKQAIYMVIETEIDKEMLARGSDEYALKVLDPAVPPELAYFPERTMWTLIGFFSAVLLALLAAFFRLSWQAAG